VNKSLRGFNGYLYKIESNLYKTYEIYFSLLAKHNQILIKLNETGTTLKHSPNSKNQLRIFKFKHNSILEAIFHLSLTIEKKLPIVNQI
jgi:hypothetical protein